MEAEIGGELPFVATARWRRTEVRRKHQQGLPEQKDSHRRHVFVPYRLTMRLKLQADEPKQAAFTLVELLIVVVILVVLAGIFIPPYSPAGKRPELTRCMSNQNQVALAATVYAMDHSDRFPWSSFDPTRAVGFSETAPELFTPLKKFAGPQIFVCPTDTKRFPTTTTLQATNLSYFLNLSSRLVDTNQVLLGDRHLALNGTAIGPGQVTIQAGSTLDWTRELHPLGGKKTQGVMSFTDGHAEIVRGGPTVSATFDRSGQREQTLLVP